RSPSRRAGPARRRLVVQVEPVVLLGTGFPFLFLVLLEHRVEQRVHNLAELLDLRPEALDLLGEIELRGRRRRHRVKIPMGSSYSFASKAPLRFSGVVLASGSYIRFPGNDVRATQRYPPRPPPPRRSPPRPRPPLPPRRSPPPRPRPPPRPPPPR